jgi:hypothetical protein
LLASVVALLIFSAAPKSEVILSQSGLRTPAIARGKLTRIKDKVVGLAAPLWRPFKRAPRQITIHSTIMRLAPNSPAVIALGNPIATNATGLRAWVLDREQLATFVAPVPAIMSSCPSITTAEGGRAGFTTQSGPTVLGDKDSLDVLLSFLPKRVSGGVRLSIDVTSLVPSAAPTLVSCQARIPDSGALIVDCSQAKAAGGKNYWFAFSPVVAPVGARLTNGVAYSRAPWAYTTTPPHSFK